METYTPEKLFEAWMPLMSANREMFRHFFNVFSAGRCGNRKERRQSRASRPGGSLETRRDCRLGRAGRCRALCRSAGPASRPARARSSSTSSPFRSIRPISPSAADAIG